MRFTLGTLVFSFVAVSARAQVSERWSSVVDGGGAYSSDTSGPSVLTASGDIVIAGGRNTSASTSTTLDPFIVRLDSSGGILWTRSPALAGVADSAVSVAVAPADGAAYVLSSPGSFNQNGLRLRKYDAAGGLLWTEAYTAPAATTIGGQVVLDAAQNAYCSGSIGSTAPGLPAEVLDGLLRSYDSSGNLRWSLLFDGAAGKGDSLPVLALDPAGGVIAVGWSNQLQSGPSDASIVRVDSAGVVAWSRTRNVTPGQSHSFRDVAVDSAGNAYALGLVSSGPTITLCEVVAYDSTGSLLWAQALPAGAVADELELDPAGAVVVVGSTGGPSSDAFVAKYSTAGPLQWQRAWSSPTNFGDFAVRVRVDSSGDVTVAGTTYTPDFQHTDSDLFVLRYDPSGNLRWSSILVAPGNANDQLGGCLVDGAGSILLSGWRRDVVGTTYGPADALVVRFDPQSFAICIGDGSGAACPCANASPVGAQAGCTNATGSGARLVDSGVASLAADTLMFTASGETPNAPTLLVQGNVNVAPVSFGDGLRCSGGTQRRMYTRSAVGGIVSVPAGGDPTVSARAAALGDSLVPGSTRVYQAYYRDPNPAFCAPPAGNTWNMSSGLLVRWSL